MKSQGFIDPGGWQHPPAIAPGVAVRASMEIKMTRDWMEIRSLAPIDLSHAIDPIPSIDTIANLYGLTFDGYKPQHMTLCFGFEARLYVHIACPYHYFSDTAAFKGWLHQLLAVELVSMLKRQISDLTAEVNHGRSEANLLRQTIERRDAKILGLLEQLKKKTKVKRKISRSRSHG